MKQRIVRITDVRIRRLGFVFVQTRALKVCSAGIYTKQGLSPFSPCTYISLLAHLLAQRTESSHFWSFYTVLANRKLLKINGGADGIRTRDLRRDRPKLSSCFSITFLSLQQLGATQDDTKQRETSCVRTFYWHPYWHTHRGG